MSLLRSIPVAALICAVTASVALAATVNGTNGPDRLIGTTSDDTVNARAGDDRVLGLSGDDRIEAGQGDDVVYGDGTCPAGSVTPGYCSTAETSRDGKDRIGGGDGNDKLFGQGGKDKIDGRNGEDRLDGGSGDDTLKGGGGADAIDGGTGDDVILARDGERDTIDCRRGNDRVRADRIDELSGGCETVVYY